MHDGDPIGNRGRDAQVVGDKEHGKAEVTLQFAEQPQDLRLNRDVQRRHRFVGDQQLRLEHERARKGDALPLPAGEGVRHPVCGGGVETDPAEQFRHARFRSLPGKAADDRGFGQGAPNGVPGIERRLRILENHLDEGAPLAGKQVFRPDDVVALKRETAAVPLQQARDDLAERRFAGAAFANQRQCFALPQRQIDAIERAYRFTPA